MSIARCSRFNMPQCVSPKVSTTFVRSSPRIFHGEHIQSNMRASKYIMF